MHTLYVGDRTAHPEIACGQNRDFPKMPRVTPSSSGCGGDSGGGDDGGGDGGGGGGGGGDGNGGGGCGGGGGDGGDGDDGDGCGDGYLQSL